MADQELILRIRADMADVQRKLRRLERDGGDSADGIARRFERAGRRISSAFRAIRGPALAVGAAGTGLAVLAQRSLAASENLVDVADRVGFTVEALQELRFAADQNGVAQRTLDMALQRFSRRVAEARNGTGELRQTLIDANIALFDSAGNARSNSAVLRDFADAIQNTETQSDALAMSFKAFDSEGAAFVTTLRGGSENLDAFAERARELGLVMEEGLARQAATASADVRVLGQVLQTQVNVAVAENAENIQQMTQALIDALPALTNFASTTLSAFNAIGQWFQQNQSWLGPLMEFSNRVDPLAMARQIPGRIADAREFLGFGGADEANAYADTLSVEQMAVDAANRRALLAISGSSGGTGGTGGVGGGGATDRAGKLGALIEATSTGMKPFKEAGEEIAKAAGDGLPAEFERNRDQISNSIQNGLRAAFDGNLLDFIKNNLQNAAFEGLANAITNAFVSEKGTGLFGSIIGGLFGGGFGGPGKATGGPASGLTLVGEQGPELVALGGMANVMTANMTRMAMSASKMTRSGGMTNVSTSLNIDARGAEVGVEERIRAVLSIEGPRLQRQAVEATISALNRSQRNTQVA